MDFYFQRAYKGELKAVIFDWAGTTVDFGCMAPAGVFVEVFKQKGIDISMSEARGPMGMHKKDHIREIARLDRVTELWNNVHGKDWTEQDIEDMFTEFIPLQLNIIKDHSELVPNALEAQNLLRERGIKIGSSTGYNNEMMKIVTGETKKHGFMPDVLVCATDVPAGRPAPWMAFKNAAELQVYPMEAFVKIGDTISDIQEGLNSGMWSVGVIDTSNEMGLTLEQFNALTEEELETKRKKVAERMKQAGAHFVINSLAEIEKLIDLINEKLHAGCRP